MSLALATVNNSDGFVSRQGPCNRPARGAPSTRCYPSTIALLFDNNQVCKQNTAFDIALQCQTDKLQPSYDNKPAWQVHCSLENISCLSAQGQASSAASLLRVQNCESVSQFTKRQKYHWRRENSTDKQSALLPPYKGNSQRKRGWKSAMKNYAGSTVKMWGVCSSKYKFVPLNLSDQHLWITLPS